MDEIYKFDTSTVIDDIPDREMIRILVTGLSDRSGVVRVAAIQTTDSLIDRVARCADVEKVEKILFRLCADYVEVDDGEGYRTSVRIEALKTLQHLKFYRLPLPQYLDWEYQKFRTDIESMVETKEEINDYGAARLCGRVKESENLVLALKILRQMLAARSEHVRRAALMSFLELARSKQPVGAVIFAALVPTVQELARTDPSSKCRRTAKVCLQSVDQATKETELAFGVIIRSSK